MGFRISKETFFIWFATIGRQVIRILGLNHRGLEEKLFQVVSYYLRNSRIGLRNNIADEKE